MKNSIGAFLCLGILVSAANTLAQPLPQQQQKLQTLHEQIGQLRGQIQDEKAKLTTLQDRLLVLQKDMRQTMGGMMGGPPLELGEQYRGIDVTDVKLGGGQNMGTADQ